MLILPQSFYNRDTLIVARELLGKVFIRKTPSQTFSGRLVEVEAYLDSIDAACHGYNGMTKRNEVMFGPPGFAYVYFTYGMHYCLNFVTEEEGRAAAVLIRALEPMEGIEAMKKNRGTDLITNLCSGPAKLTMAFGIDRTQNGLPLSGDELLVVDDGYPDFETGVSERIGLNAAADFPWRFYVKGSGFLSRREK
jgi:DNA-3-methyladenine glycosylase